MSSGISEVNACPCICHLIACNGTLQFSINVGLPRTTIERFRPRVDEIQRRLTSAGSRCHFRSDPHHLRPIHSSVARIPFFPFPSSLLCSSPFGLGSRPRSAIYLTIQYRSAALMAHRASEMARLGSEMAHTAAAPRHRRPRSMAPGLHPAVRPLSAWREPVAVRVDP